MKVSKEEMLGLILRATEASHVKTAIGGGIAVNVHGYRRETSDVDAFFHYEEQRKILGALRKILPEDYVLEEIDESHWIVSFPGMPPDERIDLMFAIGDPEESAIEMAIEKTYHEMKIPVFPVDLLVLSKFFAERGEIKDPLDIYELYRRGSYTIDDIKLRLEQMGQPDDLPRFVQLLEYLKNIPGNKLMKMIRKPRS